MAFLGSFGKFISHIAKEPVVRVLFPAALATSVGKGILHGLSNTAEQVLAGHHGQAQESQMVNYPTYQLPYGNQYSVAPSGFSDFGQGGGFAPPYYQTPEQNQPYEVQPWDYSTFSAPVTPTPSTYQALPVTYSSNSNQTSTAEDLLAFLPLLL